MSVQLTIDEIFEVAVRIEKDGAQFFRTGALVSASVDCRRTLMELAQMEADHELIFGAMREGLHAGAAAAGQAAECPVDWTGMVHLFASDALKGLAAGFSGRETPERIYRAAIDFEKDTIVFFLSFKRMLSSAADRGRLEQIIREELGHLLLLSGKLAEVLAPSGGAGRTDRPKLDAPTA